MFEKGDKYIHYTKYGGVNKGEVLYYGELKVRNIDDKIAFIKPYIINTNNIRLELGGEDGYIYKLTKEFTEDEIKNLTNFVSSVKKIKKRLNKF